MSGIQVIDIENPTLTRKISSVSVTEGIRSIAGIGHHLIAAGRKIPVRVYDVSSVKPVEICSFNCGGDIFSMDIVGSKLFMSIASFGLSICDISNLW